MNAPLDFCKKFDCVGSADDFPKKEEAEKIQTCRFCKKTAPEVSFNKKAHIVPQLLGLNNFINDFECDICNQKFSKHESHLATFFRPYLTLTNTKGQRNVPVFQSREEYRDKNSITTLRSFDDGRKELFVGNLDDYDMNLDEKKATITFRNNTINPNYVYKSLLKIGLSLLPEKDVINHKKSFDWLIEKDFTEDIGYIRTLFLTTLKGNKFIRPMALLFQAKKYFDGNIEFPNHTLIVGFANQVAQIYLPFSKDYGEIHDNSRSLSIGVFSSFFSDTIKNGSRDDIKSFDLGLDKKIKFDSTIKFSFEEFEKKIN